MNHFRADNTKDYTPTHLARLMRLVRQQIGDQPDEGEDSSGAARWERQAEEIRTAFDQSMEV